MQIAELVDQVGKLKLDNPYFVKDNGWYGGQYRWSYYMGDYGYNYNISRSPNDCGTSLLNNPAFYNIRDKRAIIIFIAQLYMLTGAGGHRDEYYNKNENRKVIFTGVKKKDIETIMQLHNEWFVEKELDIHLINTYQAHYNELEHHICIIGLPGKHRDYWIKEYISIVENDWHKISKDVKTSILLLLYLASKTDGSYSQEMNDKLNMAEVKRDIQKLLEQYVAVDKQPKALFDADFVGVML